MSYTCFQLKFKSESPIHIGNKKLGFIQQTKRFIPGTTIWGAITSNITRKFIDMGVEYSPEIYSEFGKCVEESVKSTYFYPTRNNDVLIPKFSNDGLKYGEMKKNEFDSTFVKSFVSTATTSDSGAAKDESLHETEYILNKISSMNGFIQVYWVGYLFIKDYESDKISLNTHEDLKEIKVKFENHSIKIIDALKQLIIGGDSRYGFGRLKLKEVNISKEVFGFEITLNSLKFNIEANKSIFAHLKLNDMKNISYIGEIEPLVGRIHSKKGFGRCLNQNGICFSPGTNFERNVSNIEIRSFGILKKSEK